MKRDRHGGRSSVYVCGFDGAEKVLGIIGRFRSLVQYRVVAGAFSFCTKLRGGKPGERIEPINGADRFGEELREAIEAEDVREFVGQHETQSLRRPIGR